MTENTRKKHKWFWLIPVALVLIAAALFGLRLAGGTAAPADAGPSPAPVPEEPLIQTEGGYFPAEDLFFRPEAPLTRGEAMDVFEILTGQRPDFGREDTTFSELSFPVYLKRYFAPEAVREAMALIQGRGDSLISRAEAIVCINRLTGITGQETEAYFPDVAPEYWAYEDISAAVVTEPREKLGQGFVNLDGYLYLLDDRGYFRKNHYEKSLYFDHTGRYTSGSTELDDYVAQAIAENTTDDMTREEMLRSLYEYVRGNFEYLRRHYYRTGDAGWQIQEALTMYSTGKGNCYCYASAFWAAARGLGYNAKIVSGTVGAEQSPHGWVEIVMGDVRYTYDVELEMARHRDGYPNVNLYKMTDAQRRSWNYVEADYSDDKFHRETEASLLPK